MRGIITAGDDADRGAFIRASRRPDTHRVRGRSGKRRGLALTTPTMTRPQGRKEPELAERVRRRNVVLHGLRLLAYQIEEVKTTCGLARSAIRPVRRHDPGGRPSCSWSSHYPGSHRLGPANLVTAGVMERFQLIGLMKAVGAKDKQIIAPVPHGDDHRAWPVGSSATARPSLWLRRSDATVFHFVHRVQARRRRPCRRPCHPRRPVSSIPAIRYCRAFNAAAEVLHGR